VEQEKQMGLYARLLKEKEEEERHRGGPLPPTGPWASQPRR
jgi:hypothetical protein